ncbi:hypothetical protein [Micromonospora echinospora]|uniref:hypothetical protein n=1 Tax=Micromonospora echinospora TaxID=1877 RepID=UPI000B5AE1A7|nr:hypothetical protein [Micromonospora echinospora]
MDRLTIEQRVGKLLKGDDVDDEDVRLFLTRLMQIQEAQGRDATRAISRGVALAAVFVFLSHSKILEAELLGMKVNDISPLRLVVPVAMMLMVLRAVAIMRLSAFYRRVFEEVVRRHLPNWYASGLSPLLTPWRGPMLTHASRTRLDATEHPGVDRLHQMTRMVDASASVAALVLFQVYVFVSLFQDPKVPAVATGVSLVLSSVLLILVAAYLWFVKRSGQHRVDSVRVCERQNV